MSQSEDNPPLERGRTLPPEDANQRLIRHALQQSAEATEALNKLLPQLVTKQDLAAVDGCLRMIDARIDNVESALLAKLNELIEKVDNLGHQGMSAIDIATEAKEIASGHAPTNGNGHDDVDVVWDEEEETKPDNVRTLRRT